MRMNGGYGPSQGPLLLPLKRPTLPSIEIGLQANLLGSCIIGVLGNTAFRSPTFQTLGPL